MVGLSEIEEPVTMNSLNAQLRVPLILKRIPFGLLEAAGLNEFQLSTDLLPTYTKSLGDEPPLVDT